MPLQTLKLGPGFNVVDIPVNVGMMFFTGCASGAGGAGQGAAASGAGEIMINVPIPVTPGGTLEVYIGEAGAGAKSGVYTNVDGEDTICPPFRAAKGLKAYPNNGDVNHPLAGSGGGRNPGQGGPAGSDGMMAPKGIGAVASPVEDPKINLARSSICWWSGGAGGGRSSGGVPLGGLGCYAPNGRISPQHSPGDGCGGGGASTIFANGPRGGNDIGPDPDAEDAGSTDYGVGGASASANFGGVGGDGGPGVGWLTWME